MIKKLINLKEKKYIGKFWEMGDYDDLEKYFSLFKDAEKFINEKIKETSLNYGYYICEILKRGSGVGQYGKS